MSSPELGNSEGSLSDSTPSDAQGIETQSAGDWIKPRTRSGKRQRKSRELAQQSQPPRGSKSERIANILKKVASRAEQPPSEPEEVIAISSEDERAGSAQSKRAKLPRNLKGSKPPTPRDHHRLPGDCIRSIPDVCEFDPAGGRTIKSIIKVHPSKPEELKDVAESSSPDTANVVQGCAPPPNFGNGDSDSDSSSTPKTGKATNVSGARAQDGNVSKPQAPPENSKSHGGSKPSDAVQYTANLSVHASAGDGSCLFHSLAQSLKYLLEHYPNSFNLCRFPSRRKTMQALTDPAAMRAALVNHTRLNADALFENLGGISPSMSVTDDYIDGGKILHDPEWYELMCEQAQAPILNDLPTHQTIRSFHQYLQAMSKPRAHGDEIMLAMFCNLFNLRVVVAELTSASCAVNMGDTDLILASTTLDIWPDAPVSSSFIVTLILSTNHYDWAHLSGDQCCTPTEHCEIGQNDASQVVCITTSPIAYIDLDPDCCTPTRLEIVDAHTKLLKRLIVMRCLVDEHGAVAKEAELTLSTFEKLGGQPSMSTLQELLQLHSATTYKPETDPSKAAFKPVAPLQPLFAVTAKKSAEKPSNLVKSNDAKRARSAMEQSKKQQLQQPTTEEVAADVAENVSELLSAANAVQLVTKCELDVAIAMLKRNHQEGLSYVKAVALSCQQLSAIAAKPAPPAAASSCPPPQTFNTEVSFIEQHLGAGIRPMTSAELAQADIALSVALKRTETMPPLSSLVPKNLNNYYQHHLAASATTPRGNMSHEQHAAAIRKLATTALHHEACDAAATKREEAKLTLAAEATAAKLTLAAEAAAAKALEFHTPLQQQQPARLPAAHQVQPAPATAPSAASNYQAHCSPAVRMAAARQEQTLSARSSATTVVVMSSNASKLLQWKAGSERDCKGFYWSTKLAVQQAWEQYNTAEDIYNYRTFKSTIHCTMLPIICAELQLTRAQFESISDAELIDSIDKKLKPSGPADYLIKMRQIKFDTTEPSSTSLLHRYRAFAEPFLQLLAEAAEAGCPINEESSKLAFKEQCRGNNLMMLWLQMGDRWTTASAAHQRIMTHLKSYDSLATLQSLNGLQHILPQVPFHAQPGAAQVQPAQQPPQQYYTKEQRAEYKRNGGGAQQQQAFQPRPPQAQPPSSAPVAAPISRQQLNPLFQAPQLNNVVIPLPAVTAAAPAAYSQPGLDHRGPYWHPISGKCKYSPCNSPFCQGCGEHGHGADVCKKRGKHANWNYSGYYAEQRPGQPALVYDGPARLPSQFPSSPPQQAAFPTPHTMAARPAPPASPVSSTPRNYTPVVRSNTARSNTASQHEEPANPNGGAGHQ
jgi:hypothetical protein